ncbi:DUF7269 family protein [Haloprofundus salilacus]|uniref:DUF7269 family protein n=1 Tax=Haloprofundus salilacus TaxID=2876190 RepID=UPI001CD00382|nr:hypothetical protein [Haloprofundus salilacus]
MNWPLGRRLSVLALAVGALALAVGTVFVPVALSASLAVFSRVFVFLLAGGAGLFALVILSGVGEDRARWTPENDPEQTHDGTRESAGGKFDDALSELEHQSGWKRKRERRTIERAVHDAAVTTVAARGDCSELEAARRIESGTWTTNARAASFLGGDDAASLPLRSRIRDWAAGRRFERAVEETVAELAAYDGGEPGDETSADDWPELVELEAAAEELVDASEERSDARIETVPEGESA